MLSRASANMPAMGLPNPFNQLNLLKWQMDLLSDAMFHRVPLSRFVSSGVFPAINLTEDENYYFLRAELPGMKSEQRTGTWPRRITPTIIREAATHSGRFKKPAMF